MRSTMWSDAMGTEPVCRDDAAAYLLGAMDDAEAAAFRRHLSSCEFCQEEVGALRATVEALPQMVPQMAAPRGVRRRVMAEVGADAAAKRRATGGRARRPGWSWTPGPALAGAGVLTAAGAAILAIVLIGTSGPRTIAAKLAWASASAQVRISDGHGELVVERMPAPPKGKVYEVWIKRGTAAPPRPTDALFDVNRRGNATVALPGNVGDASAVLVTAEPAGGSRTPTSAPVLVAKL